MTVLEVVIPAISVAVVNLRLMYPSPSFSHCESRVATELTYFEPAPLPPDPPLILSCPALPPDPPVAPPPPPPPPAPSSVFVAPVEPSLIEIDEVVEKESESLRFCGEDAFVLLKRRNSLRLRGGLLHYLDGDNYRIIIPKDQRNELIKLVHETLTHIGANNVIHFERRLLLAKHGL